MATQSHPTESNAAAKKATLDRHRAAFDLWLALQEMLEDVVTQTRDLEPVFARALDLLFIAAFKSHGSLYPLCVIGHCEDAATIARRIYEVALQVGYLDSVEKERENRAKQYLAYFWKNALDIVKNPSFAPERLKYWQEQYDRNKRWLILDKNGKPSNYWSGLNFAELAQKLNLKDSYDSDYRFLSNVAHASAAGLLLDVAGGTLQIASDIFVTPILVYATRYMLAITLIWNTQFGLIDSTRLEELQTRTLNFDLKQHSSRAPSQSVTALASFVLGIALGALVVWGTLTHWQTSTLPQ